MTWPIVASVTPPSPPLTHPLLPTRKTQNVEVHRRKPLYPSSGRRIVSLERKTSGRGLDGL